jgi:hypothetical protein
MRWYKFQKDFIEIDVNKNIDNQVFINAFYKHIENDIKKICKIWKTNINNIVLCNDCLRSNIWRNDIYDKYKATRNIKNNKLIGFIFISIFIYKYINIFSIIIL